ncbi:MAG TPA: DnaJ domain-containing protein, partial [Candidatus Limnocylindria bacterium]|nr:DnaJ domain-containing protein [Candidatus Limnocylindria bacterium]
MAVADPYRVLQVLPTADQVVLSAAYRALAQKYHPDHD